WYKLCPCERSSLRSKTTVRTGHRFRCQNHRPLHAQLGSPVVGLLPFPARALTFNIKRTERESAIGRAVLNTIWRSVYRGKENRLIFGRSLVFDRYEPQSGRREVHMSAIVAHGRVRKSDNSPQCLDLAHLHRSLRLHLRTVGHTAVPKPTEVDAKAVLSPSQLTVIVRKAYVQIFELP